MRVVEYFTQIESVNRAFFTALSQADALTESQRAYLEPKYRHDAVQFERWSNFDDVDDSRLNSLHANVFESRDALLLADVAAAAAAGALLQTAKQCIAMRWPEEGRSFKDEHLSYGRKVGSQPLSKVIWCARNQALHFEEGTPKRASTNECISTLAKEFKFAWPTSGDTPRSLAREVVRALDWNSYELYATDIVSLVGEA